MLVKVVAIFGVINRLLAKTPAPNVFCFCAVALIQTSSVNLAFKPKSGFKKICRVQAWKWGPFATLCGYVGRGQQVEIERKHPQHINSKIRLKSFGEVDYANFRPNVFCRWWEDINGDFGRVGAAFTMPSSIKKICSFFKKRKCARKIFIVFVKRASNCCRIHRIFRVGAVWKKFNFKRPKLVGTSRAIKSIFYTDCKMRQRKML